MFGFLLKKTVKSNIFIIIVLITSLSLLSEFMPYFQFFPIDSQDKLNHMSNVGGASDFVRCLSSYDEETQLKIAKDYYSNILVNDKSLKSGEKEIIQNKILESSNMDQFYDASVELFYYSIDIGTDAKHEAYFNELENTSGANYIDVNERIDDSIKDYNISYYFAMRYADRLVIMWSMLLFVFVTFRYCTMNGEKVRNLIYPKPFRSRKYVLENIGIEFLAVSIVAFIQMFIFAFLFDMHLKGVYVTDIYDYVKMYFVWVLPSLAILITIINLLYYIFDSPIVAFPIYYIIESISSKITPNLGYTINKTNLIIRYDTLFHPLSYVEQNDLMINRIIMVSMIIIFIPIMVHIMGKKRLGNYILKIRIWGQKNGKKLSNI